MAGAQISKALNCNGSALHSSVMHRHRKAKRENGEKELERMNSITKETRFESYLKTEPNKRSKLVLQALEDGPKTARQVMRYLGFKDLNQVRPRISELLKEGRIEVAGKAYDEYSKRNVAVFRKVG